MIEVEITSDNMETYITLKKVDGEDISFSAENAVKMLQAHGVKYGIDHDAIQELIDQEKMELKTLCAKGKEPIKGEDAHLEYFFRTERSLKPKVAEDGQVDYREINLVDSVEKDAVLVKKTPAAAGIPGINVLGEELEAPPGKNIEILAANGTYRDPEDENIIKAAIDGIIYYNSIDNVLEVQNLFVVRDSVNYSTGNIRVKSSVEVHGDINPGFVVETPYNVQVKGVVEHATILCGGSLNVNKGIVGDGSTEISVKGDLHSGYIHNQNVKCIGGVYVASEILNSNIESNDEVIVAKGTGALIGGNVSAMNKITAANIGSEEAIPTVVEVGVDSEHRQELLKKQKQKAAIGKKLCEIRDKLSCIVKQSSSGVHDFRVNLFKGDWKKYTHLHQKLKSEVEELEKLVYPSEDPSINVQGKVYPGVTVVIKNAQFCIKTELSRVLFKFKDNEVQMFNI